MPVRDGALGTYLASPNYKVFATNGLIQRDPWLHERLIEELMACTNRED